jgi:hypothetical protein
MLEHKDFMEVLVTMSLKLKTVMISLPVVTAPIKLSLTKVTTKVLVAKAMILSWAVQETTTSMETKAKTNSTVAMMLTTLEAVLVTTISKVKAEMTKSKEVLAMMKSQVATKLLPVVMLFVEAMETTKSLEEPTQAQRTKLAQPQVITTSTVTVVTTKFGVKTNQQSSTSGEEKTTISLSVVTTPEHKSSGEKMETMKLFQALAQQSRSPLREAKAGTLSTHSGAPKTHPKTSQLATKRNYSKVVTAKT